MNERSYYPAGAYNDPNAPYNRVETPEATIEQEVTCLLYGVGSFKSDEYTGGYYDDEGDKVPTEYCGSRPAYSMVQEQMYTPMQLLKEYGDQLETLINGMGDKYYPSKKLNELKLKLKSCRMWTEEAYENA